MHCVYWYHVFIYAGHLNKAKMDVSKACLQHFPSSHISSHISFLNFSFLSFPVPYICIYTHICAYKCICVYVYMYIKESLRTYSTGTISVFSQASYSLRKRQDFNINIPNDVIELCQRTYCSAFIFSFALYNQLSGLFVPIPLILVGKKMLPNICRSPIWICSLKGYQWFSDL